MTEIDPATAPGAAAAATAAVAPTFWRRLGGVYRHHMIHNRRRERLFLAWTAFLLTFVFLRLLTLAIHDHVGPFGNVAVGGVHLHHLVWGILLMLIVGYVWLVEFGTGDPARDLLARLTALAYGVAAALTLDEFALWLNLRDVYWEQEGRQSIEAAFAFAALLAVGLIGAPLWRGLAWELRAMGREWRSVEQVVEHEFENKRPGP